MKENQMKECSFLEPVLASLQYLLQGYNYGLCHHKVRSLICWNANVLPLLHPCPPSWPTLRGLWSVSCSFPTLSHTLHLCVHIWPQRRLFPHLSRRWLRCCHRWIRAAVTREFRLLQLQLQLNLNVKTQNLFFFLLVETRRRKSFHSERSEVANS